MQAITQHPTNERTELNPADAVQDVSGYTIFSSGDTGAAHAMAHQMLDDGRFKEGHILLGSWLEGRTGSGSQWVHLQFHMAVFELAIGDFFQAATCLSPLVRRIPEIGGSKAQNDLFSQIEESCWRSLAAAEFTTLTAKAA
jgi:hypothetical protein